MHQEAGGGLEHLLTQALEAEAGAHGLLQRLAGRTHRNKAVVGLANKIARRAYAVCRDQADYDAQFEGGRSSLSA